MNSNLERVLMLLSASGLSDKVVLDALKASAQYHPARIAARLRLLRDVQEDLQRSDEAQAVDSRAPKSSGGVEDDVVLLLQKEAHLTAATAARLLEHELRRSLPSRTFPEYRSKEGLRAWVRRLSRDMPPSELLHYAVRVRNTVVHNDKTDWPLKNSS